MSIEKRIQAQFKESIAVKQVTAAQVTGAIASAIRAMAACLQSGGKIMACGNGGSAADAQHFAAELINRYERERPPLAAIALTTDSSILTSIGNDYRFEDIFAKQVAALGKTGDVLLAISTSGNSPNIVEAIHAAHARGVRVAALTGRGGGKMAALLTTNDFHLCVPAQRTGRIQETHLVILHCLCDGIDQMILGDEQ